MTKTCLLRVKSVSLSENVLLGLKYYRVVVVKLFKDKVYLYSSRSFRGKFISMETTKLDAGIL